MKTVVVGTKVPVIVKEALTSLAKAKGQTPSEFLRDLISSALNQVNQAKK